MPARAASGADSAAQTTCVSPARSCAFRDRKSARHGANATVERELTDGCMLGEALRWKLSRSAEDGQ
jgi:hypothetical protein